MTPLAPLSATTLRQLLEDLGVRRGDDGRRSSAGRSDGGFWADFGRTQIDPKHVQEVVSSIRGVIIGFSDEIVKIHTFSLDFQQKQHIFSGLSAKTTHF